MQEIRMIFLVGMPGAGKTWWGEKLAEGHDWLFADLDRYIESEVKASISALFASYGENGFRERENKFLKKLIKTSVGNTVVACGGGTPCFLDNLQLMKGAGKVVYLRADVPELIANLNASDHVRPLLKGRGDMDVYLGDLLKKRKHYYEQADHILPIKDISLTNFAKIFS